MVGRQDEQLIASVQSMNRRELIRLLRELDCGFEIDLSDEFLRSISVEQLRHIVTAISLHTKSVPEALLRDLS